MTKDQHKKGLKAIWITPLSALSHEIKQSAESVASDSGTSLTVGIRSGDTSTSERAKQKKDQVFVIAEGVIIKIWPFFWVKIDFNLYLHKF